MKWAADKKALGKGWEGITTYIAIRSVTASSPSQEREMLRTAGSKDLGGVGGPWASNYEATQVLWTCRPLKAELCPAPHSHVKAPVPKYLGM